MIAGRFKRFRILVVPGLHDSGPRHWQTLWQKAEPKFERVEQQCWDEADLVSWSASIASTLRRSARPAVLIAHSFGCLAAVHCAANGARNLHGMFLVAPADPQRFGLEAALRIKLPCSASLVASANDPWMDADRAAQWSRQWGAEFHIAGALGHINAESGIGAWPQGQSLFASLLERLPAPAICCCGQSCATGTV